MTAGPLRKTALDSDEAWGAKLEISCACGAKLCLWDFKCKGCKAKNPFLRLLKKRKRIEGWIDRQIQSGVVPKLTQAQLLLESACKYDAVLREVVRRPFPEHQKSEDLNMFMRRVVNFFPSMFKSTSPKQMALGISDSIKRSSAGMARAAWKECENILDGVTGQPVAGSQGHLLSEQAERVATDLLNICKSYVEALKTLQLGHTRMVTAYGPAKEIFARNHQSGGTKGLWNKARLKFKPVGERLRLPTAIWKNQAEHEDLKHLDSQLAKFMEQIRWFSDQTGKLQDRQAVLMNTYMLSLRKHLVYGLARRIGSAEPQKRPLMVKRLLSQKGVGSLLWRLFFGLRI
ncbi:MAG: hypothetical protein JRJ87_15210 [Deltaproteobacteria bacterium]|nr:hypothetical protein [Deltaproteobacteria bacterium]